MPSKDLLHLLIRPDPLTLNHKSLLFLKMLVAWSKIISLVRRTYHKLIVYLECILDIHNLHRMKCERQGIFVILNPQAQR